MISDEAFVRLQAENAVLRRQVTAARLRLNALEPKVTGYRGVASAPRAVRMTAPPITRRELRRRLQLWSTHDQLQVQSAHKGLQIQRRDASLALSPQSITAPLRRSLRDARAQSSRPVGVARQGAAQSATVHPAQRLNTLRNAASNTLMLLSGQILTWTSTLILAAAYGRFLGAAKFGELYLATTFLSLIGFPIESSFNQQIVRDVAREPRDAHRYITMALALKGSLWVGLYILAQILAVALGYSSEERWLIAVCGLMLISTAVSSTLISIETAYHRVGPAKFGVVLEKGLDCVLAVLLLRAGAGVQVVALVLLFGSIAGMTWQIVRVMHMIGIRFVWAPQVARDLMRSGVSFLVYGVLGVIYYRIDTVMLSVFGTAAAVGVYGAAYRLLDTLMFVPGIVIGAVVSPMMSKYFVDNTHKLRLTVEKSTIAMLLCSLPATAGLLVTAPNIIGFVYHRHDFVGSDAVLQGLAIGLIALYLNTVLTTVLVSTGQERKLPIMAAIALVFNVGINFVLIPRFMAVGAAWATSLTEILLFGIGLVLIDRALIPVQLWLATLKIIVATLLMAGVAYMLTTYNILVILPVAGVVYIGAILGLRVLPAEDLARLKGAFARFQPRSTRTRAPNAEQRTPAGDASELAPTATKREAATVA